MIVYLSGPISGNDPVKVLRDFKLAEMKLQSEGHTVVNPMEVDHTHDRTWEAYMRRDIVELMRCEAIYMLPGWERSRGAQIELQLAKSLNFIILQQ